jgi:hypothetical protein
LLVGNSGKAINNLFINHESAIDAIFSACSLSFRNNTITGCEEGGVLAVNGSWFVENNIWHHNPGTLNMLMLNLQRDYDTAYVANNLFYRNQGNSPSYPPSVLAFTAVEAINNTFVGPYNLYYDRAIYVGEYNDLVLSSSRNNAISGFYNAFYVYQGPSEINVSYNNIWDVEYNHGGNGQVHYLDGNIFTDPMYVDTNDFRLQMFSPLIDAGDPTILDVDGTRSDIGCYGGPGGCSYTYLDLAPRIPDSISVFVDSGMITLEWPFNTEADFNRYQIYRDTVPSFEPSIFDIIAEPDTSYYEDTDIIPDTPYYYRLTSVDNQGNISDFSEEIAVVPTSAWDIIEANLPYEPKITSAYPNPFNSNVVIVYSASNLGVQPPLVTLKVYDIQGRLVKTLVDDRIPMGTYRSVWDGTNDDGQPVASGTYIARVAQWGCPAGDFPVKITLIR